MSNSVPNTNNFTLQDVVDVINPNPQSLVQSFLDAVDQSFDPLYVGDKDRLLNFRNYGFDFIGFDGYYYNRPFDQIANNQDSRGTRDWRIPRHHIMPISLGAPSHLSAGQLAYSGELVFEGETSYDYEVLCKIPSNINTLQVFVKNNLEGDEEFEFLVNQTLPSLSSPSHLSRIAYIRNTNIPVSGFVYGYRSGSDIGIRLVNVTSSFNVVVGDNFNLSNIGINGITEIVEYDDLGRFLVTSDSDIRLLFFTPFSQLTSFNTGFEFISANCMGIGSNNSHSKLICVAHSDFSEFESNLSFLIINNIDTTPTFSEIEKIQRSSVIMSVDTYENYVVITERYESGSDIGVIIYNTNTFTVVSQRTISVPSNIYSLFNVQNGVSAKFSGDGTIVTVQLSPSSNSNIPEDFIYLRAFNFNNNVLSERFVDGNFINQTLGGVWINNKLYLNYDNVTSVIDFDLDDVDDLSSLYNVLVGGIDRNRLGKILDPDRFSGNNTSITNELDFSLVGVGYIDNAGQFLGKNIIGGFWVDNGTTISWVSTTAYKRRYVGSLVFSFPSLNAVSHIPIRFLRGPDNYGFPIRLVRDILPGETDLVEAPDGDVNVTYYGNDGKTYPVLKLNNKLWIKQNLEETKLRNETLVDVSPNAVDWTNSTVFKRAEYDYGSTPPPPPQEMYLFAHQNIGGGNPITLLEFTETGVLSYNFYISSTADDFSVEIPQAHTDWISISPGGGSLGDNQLFSLQVATIPGGGLGGDAFREATITLQPNDQQFELDGGEPWQFIIRQFEQSG